MKYRLHQFGAQVTLEVTDDDGDATFYAISGNTVFVADEIPAGAVVLGAADGDWHHLDGIAEFRTPTWKLRVEGDTCTVRTGDGARVEHLFSGHGPGRTGESAARRLISFFDGSDFRGTVAHGC